MATFIPKTSASHNLDAKALTAGDNADASDDVLTDIVPSDDDSKDGGDI